MQKNKNPFLAAPILLVPAFLGLILLKWIGGAISAGASAAITAAWLFLVAFGISIGFFFLFGRQRVSPDRFRQAMHFRRLSGAEFGLLFFSALLLIALRGVFCGIFSTDAETFAFFSAQIVYPEGVTLIVAVIFLCMIPAFLEELLLRGILFYEYRYAGAGVLWIGAAFAALFSMRFSAVPYVFLSALLLGIVVRVSGNLLCSSFANLLMRLGLLFLEPLFARVSLHKASRTVLLVLSALFLLASCFLFLYFAEKCLTARAERETLPLPRAPKGKGLRIAYDILRVPVLWAEVGASLICAIIGAIL